MADTQPQEVSITIDGVERNVPAGELLIKAAQETGTYIPRFCWHPRMKPVGMCRMCLVEVEGPRGTMLTTSCTMPVTDGMVVHTESEVVKKAQEGVLEFLLINHPLDCPVCDKGGECPLQDQTVAYGPGETRFVEEKRHFEKPIPISDLVFLDRERCILCARCTRFSDEISGDPLIEFKDRGNHTQVITFPDEPFASYFSGNTVQICPVGALTATPYRFRARPWDLEAVESVSTARCGAEGLGAVEPEPGRPVHRCRQRADQSGMAFRQGSVRVRSDQLRARLATPLIKANGEFREATWTEALDLVADRLRRHGRAADRRSRWCQQHQRRGIRLRQVPAYRHRHAAPRCPARRRPRPGLPRRSRLAGGDRRSRACRRPFCCGPAISRRSCPSSTCGCAARSPNSAPRSSSVHPRRTGLDDVATHTFTTGRDAVRRRCSSSRR